MIRSIALAGYVFARADLSPHTKSGLKSALRTARTGRIARHSKQIAKRALQ